MSEIREGDNVWVNVRIEGVMGTGLKHFWTVEGTYVDGEQLPSHPDLPVLAQWLNKYRDGTSILCHLDDINSLAREDYEAIEELRSALACWNRPERKTIDDD